jgi:hypothetical protein
MSIPSDVRNDSRWGAGVRDTADPFRREGEGEVPVDGFATRAASAQRASPIFALVRAIPDSPNYQKYVPIEYRLNAKAIVGHLSEDLSKGESAHVWAELAHAGITVAEIFAETSILVSGLAIAGPFLALASSFLALGAPYQEAASHIAAAWSATGFSRGVVMGADRRPARQLIDYFGNDHFSENAFFPHGRDVAIANYRSGLIAGNLHGRLLSPNQRVIFWRDLGRRMGDQSYRGPQERWGRRQWSDWYTDVAAVFNRDHLVHSR